jgi:hypothetical protein
LSTPAVRESGRGSDDEGPRSEVDPASVPTVVGDPRRFDGTDGAATASSVHSVGQDGRRTVPVAVSGVPPKAA